MKENFITRLFKKELDVPVPSDLIGWHESNTVNVRHYMNQANQYENGYSSIRAISKRFMSIDPYAIDVNGKPVKDANIINVLSRPNQDMSMIEFRDALATMTLVHNKTYIRVHHKGGQAREGNVFGFTILEGVIEIPDKDGIHYQTRQGTVLEENEVIVLKDINPYNLDAGYSPAQAGRTWANLDDLIAAYHTGFFENGAVPAGQFVINAASQSEFEDIVRNLKTKTRGASKNNNVIYSFAPNNPVTGQPGSTDIQWVPFNTASKDMALDVIFEQANKKVDSIYGVPASMRGVNDNNTYASVRVDEQIFINNTVRPFSRSIWDRFTFELNRITGGLGYTIVFDLDTPNVAEEEKAKAEAQNTQISSITTLTDKGFTLKSAILAVTTDDLTVLKLEEKPAPTPAPAVEDVEEVDEGEEVEDAPDEEKTKEIDSIDVNCKHCGRYLFRATGTTVIEEMPCPKCKAKSNFKIINPLGDDKTHEFTFKEEEPKDIKAVALHKQMSEESKALITDKIEKEIRNMMERQIERVDVKSKKLDPVDAADAELYAQQVLAIVTPLITSEGMKQYLLARLVDGVEGANLKSGFALSEKQLNDYRAYLEGVAKGYSEDTEKQIKSVLEEGIGQKLPAQEIKKNLQSVMQTDEWRVKRLALTETNRAGNAGSIYAMEQVGKEEDIKIEKVWQAQSGACEYCRALDGTAVEVSDDFVPKGETIKGEDGGERVNDFGHMDVPTAHPNCSCYVTYKVVK